MNYSRISFLVAILFLFTFSVSGQNNSVLKKLNSIYEMRGEGFDAFMDNWSLVSKDSGKDITTLTGIEKAVYQIHKDFFQPFNFKFYGWEAWGDRSWFTEAKYIIIQSKVPVQVVSRLDSLRDDAECNDTIFNFRPDVMFNQAVSLYLFPEYENAFKNFLDRNCFIDQGIMNSKTQFLEKIVTTTLKNDWTTIITQPEILAVYLSKDHIDAIVDYRIASTGMRSFLQKENDHWSIRKSHQLWIE